MELNAAGSWTLVVAVMALVALVGTTLTAANSGMAELERSGLTGIAFVLVITGVVIAATLRRVEPDDGSHR